VALVTRVLGWTHMPMLRRSELGWGWILPLSGASSIVHIRSNLGRASASPNTSYLRDLGQFQHTRAKAFGSANSNILLAGIVRQPAVHSGTAPERNCRGSSSSSSLKFLLWQRRRDSGGGEELLLPIGKPSTPWKRQIMRRHMVMGTQIGSRFKLVL
jgi:hypothetical protein